MRDLFPTTSNATNGKPTLGPIIAAYPYRDAEGHTLYQVTRHNPKDFRQRKPKVGGGWTWKLNGTPRVPYRLPELLAAPADEWVFIVEGEKDADALAKLGRIATTNAGGANKWHTVDVATVRRAFAGRRVAILPDNDAPGRQHARDVARRLEGIAAEVRIVELPDVPPKGDVSDWFKTGGTVERLLELVESTDGRETPEDAEPPTSEPKGEPGAAEATAEPSALNLLNDTGNGERFARRYADTFRYCWPWRKWLCWDGRRWKVDEKGRAEKAARVAIKRDLHDATNEVAALANELADDADDAEAKARLAAAKRKVQFLLASLDRRRIDALLSFARSELPVGHDELNAHPTLLNCLNGTLDLETGELRPHRREDYLTTLCPRNYRPDAPRENFGRFLTTILPSDGLRRFVRQLFGLGLLGKVHEHLLPIYWGAGRNGKTTLIEAVCQTLGTDYADAIVPDLLLARKGDSNHPTEIADLYGKRILSAAETKDGKWLNSAAVKRLTGGDTLKGRRMREDFWSFTPSHTIFLLTNNKPRVEGQELAIWSRLKLVPFNATFYKPNELPPGTDPLYQADPRMPEKLLAEAEGVLAWMVDGCLDWHRNGLIVPAEVEEATGDYKAESDIVGRFLGECTQPMTGAKVKAGDLYARFLAWLKANGEECQLTQTAFGIQLNRHGIMKEKVSCVRYCGIALIFDADEERENR